MAVPLIEPVRPLRDYFRRRSFCRSSGFNFGEAFLDEIQFRLQSLSLVLERLRLHFRIEFLIWPRVPIRRGKPAGPPPTLKPGSIEHISPSTSTTAAASSKTHPKVPSRNSICIARHTKPSAISCPPSSHCPHSHGSCSIPSWHCSILLKNQLLFPGHCRPALGAFSLDTGHAAFVWFLLPALRTDAEAAGSSCEATTSALTTSPTSALTTASTSALTTASASAHPASSIHRLFPPVDAHLPELVSAAAARHGKYALIEAARKPSLDDLS